MKDKNDKKEVKSASFPVINSAHFRGPSDADSPLNSELTLSLQLDSALPAHHNAVTSDYIVTPNIPIMERPSRSDESPLLRGRKMLVLADEDNAVTNKKSLCSQSNPLRAAAMSNKQDESSFRRRAELTLFALQRVIQNSMDLVSAYRTSLTRQQFAALNPEELGRIYDIQDKNSKKILDELQQGLDLCIDPSHQSIANLAESSQGFFAKKQPILTREQYKVLNDLAITAHSVGVILLVDDSLVMLKALLTSVTSSLNDLLKSKEQLTLLQDIENKEWQNVGFKLGMLANWTVICAANGLVAIEIFRVIKVSILITDYQMPGMNGVELITFIRSQQQLEDLLILPIALYTTLSKEQLFKEQATFDPEKLRVTYLEKNQCRDALNEFFVEHILRHEALKLTSFI